MSKKFRSDKKGIHLLSLAALILTVIVLVVLEVLRRYLTDKFPEYLPNTEQTLPQEVVAALMVIFAALYVIFIVIILPLWYRTIKYELTDACLITDTGLFSHTHRVMKLSAVQHASRISIPIPKRSGFNFISVNAMGGTILLMFLSDTDCAEVLEILRRSAEKSTVADRTKEDKINDAIRLYDKSVPEPEAPKREAGTVTYTSSSDLDDLLGELSYTQLSFEPQEEDFQLSFIDSLNDSKKT